MRELRIIPIALFFALLFLCTSLFAQEKPSKPRVDKKDKIEQLKIAYFTQELDLSSEEAEKFWPIYNDLSDEMKKKRKAQRKLNKELKENFESLTDDEIKEKSEAILDSSIEQAELKKEYHEKFAEVLGYKKATKLLSLEQQFKKELLERLNRPDGPQGKKKPEMRQPQ